MKGAGKILLTMMMATSCMVLFVHLKVSLFHLSYGINGRSAELAEKGERYRQLRFEVDQLRAPGRLANKVDELSLDLTLPKEIEVMKVRNRIEKAQVNPPIVREPVSFTSQLKGFVNRWVGVAQAKE